MLTGECGHLLPVGVGKGERVGFGDFSSTAKKISDSDTDFKLSFIWKDVCSSSFPREQKCLKWDYVFGKCFYWALHVPLSVLGSTQRAPL